MAEHPHDQSVEWALFLWSDVDDMEAKIAIGFGRGWRLLRVVQVDCGGFRGFAVMERTLTEGTAFSAHSASPGQGPRRPAT